MARLVHLSLVHLTRVKSNTNTSSITMKMNPYSHSLNRTLHELSDWFREPLSEFDPFSRLLGHQRQNGVIHDHADATTATARRLAADLYETDTDYVARFHLPGVRKDDLTIRLEPDATLAVRYETVTGEGEDPQKTLRAGRTLRLPETINRDSVEATLEEGVLTVTVGKQAPQQSRTISIR